MNAGPDAPTRVRYRVRFAKVDLLRWISHRDLAMLWDRLGRRVGLDFSMTEGFHPKPRINFPSALALGIESDNEIVELDLATELEPADLLSRLVSDAQPGLIIHQVARLPEGFGKSRVESLHYRIDVPDDCTGAEIDAGIDKVMTTAAVTLQRKKKNTEIRPSEQIISLQRVTATGNDAAQPSEADAIDAKPAIAISLVQREVAGALIKPDEVISLMPIDDFVARGGTVRRVDVQLTNPYPGDDVAVAGPQNNTDAVISTADPRIPSPTFTH